MRNVIKNELSVCMNFPMDFVMKDILWDFLKSETYIGETQIEEYRNFLKQVFVFLG